MVSFGLSWMETFKAISKEGSICRKMIRCFDDGTWSCVLGACTVVRDFSDFSFHSYFSVMDELLESKGEEPIELKYIMQFDSANVRTVLLLGFKLFLL
ncbi:hypothetical protein OIU79_000674 [Salix purpurea]|uniref:Uncharacterized protein n=1 Tax=Salix purpurea TaxID=77065 RepID=A0A9Q0ZN51_SALPP|nr:hypothetical protein OIU79_000674 [Salix purpurea]